VRYSHRRTARGCALDSRHRYVRDNDGRQRGRRESSASDRTRPLVIEARIDTSQYSAQFMPRSLCFPARRRAAGVRCLPSSLVAGSSLLSPDSGAALWLAGGH
jgi:hypothetical protein